MTRKASFKKWLIDEKHMAPGTANSYSCGVKKIQNHYRNLTGDYIDFYLCNISDIPTLKNILKDYEPKAKFEHIFNDNGTARNGLRKYIEFLTCHFQTPQAILLKHPSNVNITKLLDNTTLQTLILQQYDKLFPGYTLSKITIREGFIFLENKEERKVLGIMPDKQDKDASRLFWEMSQNLPDLQALCTKEKMSFHGIIIASTDKKKDLDVVTKSNSAISVKTYSVSLNLLD